MKTLLALSLALGCAVSARATTFVYSASLSGTNESPINASPATGSALVTFDDVLNTLNVNFTFSGLTGTTTAAHIHAATTSPGIGNAIVATTTPFFPGFTTGVSNGTYNGTLDLTLTSSYNSAFITANGGTVSSAEAALISALNTDKSYLNIHSTTFAGGEIRGYLLPVPEPSSLALLGLGTMGMAVWFRNKKSNKQD